MADQVVSVSRVIHATPEAIFDVIADPSRHGEIDGSDTVQHIRGESNRLALGSKFGMDMKMGPLPYRITNTVKEFEENRLIAWAHFGGHRWRYELEPIEVDGDPATKVTESFDWSTTNPAAAKGIELAGYPKRHPANMAATLDRLAAVVEA
ncbi:MAG: SRPBCC family protein [Ilumatobacter sp.]